MTYVYDESKSHSRSMVETFVFPMVSTVIWIAANVTVCSRYGANVNFVSQLCVYEIELSVSV